MCYHASMRVGLVAVVALLVASTAFAAAEERDPLTKARLFYNQRKFDAAIQAADEARSMPSLADAADLIAARAYLERFRESAGSDDLARAHDRLGRVDPRRFGVRERAEYVVGLGEALFFDGRYGAAADVFDSVLAGMTALPPEDRERVLDWWATALDNDARPRSELDRQPVYQRIRDRMQEELGRNPASATAAYWLAAAARAQGDVQAAWDAAEAAWVRARLAGDGGAALRADVDRLVLRGIVPERAKVLARPPEALRLEWERFKELWSRE